MTCKNIYHILTSENTRVYNRAQHDPSFVKGTFFMYIYARKNSRRPSCRAYSRPLVIFLENINE